MLEDYVEAFSKLHTDKNRDRWTPDTRHRAPHKPLLLLAVLDEFAQGSVTTNLIEPDLELVETFTLYWSRVMPVDRRSSMALPFFHLKSDGFWRLLPQPDKQIALNAARSFSSMNQLRGIVLGAKLDEKLFALLQVQSSREKLRYTLIETYFAAHLRSQLVEQGLINVQSFDYSQALLNEGSTVKAREKQPDEKTYTSAVRDQGFRRAVVKVYNHRCALCGIRMLTSDGHTAVDAAHIIPWSESHRDDPCNGMALCRLCHWAFDEGLMGVSKRYQVMTSRQLNTGHNVPGHLLTLDQRSIIGPVEESLWPDLDALGWHRKHVFRPR